MLFFFSYNYFWLIFSFASHSGHPKTAFPLLPHWVDLSQLPYPALSSPLRAWFGSGLIMLTSLSTCLQHRCILLIFTSGYRAQSRIFFPCLIFCPPQISAQQNLLPMCMKLFTAIFLLPLGKSAGSCCSLAPPTALGLFLKNSSPSSSPFSCLSLSVQSSGNAPSFSTELAPLMRLSKNNPKT